MSEIICGLKQAQCICSKEKDHEGPHLCECEGSWTFDEKGEFVIVALPVRGVTVMDPILFAMLSYIPIVRVKRGGIRFIDPPEAKLIVDEEIDGESPS